MPLGVGPMEIVIVAIIALLILGPKRLPGAGRALGKGISEFKASVTGQEERDELTEPEPEPERT